MPVSVVAPVSNAQPLTTALVPESRALSVGASIQPVGCEVGAAWAVPASSVAVASKHAPAVALSTRP
jgi:hypothetical protein